MYGRILLQSRLHIEVHLTGTFPCGKHQDPTKISMLTVMSGRKKIKGLQTKEIEKDGPLLMSIKCKFLERDEEIVRIMTFNALLTLIYLNFMKAKNKTSQIDFHPKTVLIFKKKTFQ
jgi:hypothetical protein